MNYLFIYLFIVLFLLFIKICMFIYLHDNTHIINKF
jgi:hypothetical protein